ncbi:MAG: hypothetical protein QOI95_3278 [Acidimicrobiaceae bacterium]|jgi:hypothetical protein
MISHHPAVARSPKARKEVRFFDARFGDDVSKLAADEYARYFPRPDGSIAGEWTPGYMHDYWTPRGLAEVAPDARLLVMLRDPVERYQSGLALAFVHNAPRHAIVASDQAGRGFYHGALVRLLRQFPRSQVLVLQMERCIASPEGELARTYEFLGLDPIPAPDDLSAVVHGDHVRPALSNEHRRLLVEAYADDVAALLADFPELDVSLWPNFAHLYG